MSGFVEIAKIILKVGFFVGVIAIIISIGLTIANLAGVLDFLNGLFSTFTGIIQRIYNLLYFWTGGAFKYIYIAGMSILIAKLVFWSVYGLIQMYKIVVEWLFK